MKLVFTHPSPIIVAQARNEVERAGIECVLRNEYASGAIGELAPIEAWGELWVLRDNQQQAAKAIVAEMQKPVEGVDWTCPACSNGNPATFDFCWSCAVAKTEA